mmetsp:Transcript_4726/g.7989  ORF Transcript_4726/g.7989 Transcript_4726/m.7989 type:complete len:226 (+) Transcript_4726:637-1314(+)
MLLTTAFCIAFIGTTPAGAVAMAGAGAAFTGAAAEGAGAGGGEALDGASPAAISTSSGVIRPKLPVPLMVSSLIPFVLANFLAAGVATTPKLETNAGGAAAAAGATETGVPLAAASTSSAIILPPGPLPTSRDRSMPLDSASVFAKGLTKIRPSAVAAGAAMGAGAAGEGVASGAATAGAAATDVALPAGPAAATFSISSADLASNATGAPTAATSPSPVKIAAR